MSTEICRSIITVYRKELYQPFCQAVDRYGLIQDGDRILVAISGGKDSFLLALCLKELQQHGDKQFSLHFLALDPGYEASTACRIKALAEQLGIEVEIVFDDSFVSVADQRRKSPCFLCARMRRGLLYKAALARGCNKLALGHHFDDVIETTLLSLFYSGEIKTMKACLSSANYPLKLIRPLYLVKERSIEKWRDRFGLRFVQCACPLGQKEIDGRRHFLKRQLAQADEQIRMNIFRALDGVNDD